MLFILGNYLISWHSLKQWVVLLSSCEAEYIAATFAATQALWLAWVLGKLLGKEAEAVELRVESKSTRALAKNPVFHERSVHIRIKYHFIRSCFEDRSVKANHINTADQLADILTESIGRSKFQEMRAQLGLVHMNSKITHKA
jgi:hypothetical protein